MNRLKIAIASFLLVNSFTFAETLTEFQTKAVKDLYNKGILQTIVKEEDFSKKDSFSRGEIASIIYNTISLKGAETVKGASSEDLTVLRALISDFSSELAKLGATDYDLFNKINEVDKKINTRIDSELVILNKKIDRLSLSGDVTFVKEFDTVKDSNSLAKDPKGEGDIRLTLNISDEIKGKVGYNFDKEQGEYALDIKGKDFNLSLFNDDMLSKSDWANWTTEKTYFGDIKRSQDLKNKVATKKLPDFSNGFGLINKGGINNKDTIVLSKKMDKKDVLALVTSTENEDIYGIQYRSKMGSFMTTPGSDANMNISYIGIDDKLSNTKDKNFLILGADFVFPINANAKQSFVYNYSKMNTNEDISKSKDVDYFFPIVSSEATYVNAKTDIDSKKLGKVEVVLAGLNTGYNFDGKGLSDSEKQVFAESDLIKLESNRFGGMAIVKNIKGAFENKFSSINYKTNDETKIDNTMKAGTLYSFKDGKTKVGLNLGQSSEKKDENSTKYKRDFVETELHLTNTIANNSKDLLRINVAKEKNSETNEFTAYLEHRETRAKANLLVASEFKDVVDENSVKAAVVYEKADKFSEKYDGKVLLGGRYDKDLHEKDSKKAEKYAVFTKVDVQVKENVNIKGGVRYSDGRTSNNGTTFAAAVTYDFTKDFKISGIYGPIDVLDDYSSDVFKNKTDGIYGEKEQTVGSIKISGKF